MKVTSQPITLPLSPQAGGNFKVTNTTKTTGKKKNSYHFNKPKSIDKRTRKCLTCGNDFMSWGPGNRMCTDCKGGRSRYKGW